MRHQELRVVVLLVTCWCATSALGGNKVERTEAAAQLIADALRQEMQGTDEQRNAMLESALEQMPDYPPALWQNGYVLDRKKWKRFDDLAELLTDDVRLAAYRRKREETPDTIEGHMALASLCTKRRLTDQRRAHLTRVLQFDPDHVEARRQLGYQLVDGNWMTRQGIADALQCAREITVAMRRWRPELLDIREAVDHRSLHRRQAAVERLMAVDDASAIEPI